MSQNKTSKIWALFGVFFILGVLSGTWLERQWQSLLLGDANSFNYLLTQSELRVEVKRVIDGDTLVLASGQRVRLLGLDAPEISAGTRQNKQIKKFQSSQENWQSLANQSKYILEQKLLNRDVKISIIGDICDRYGRLLAYVYVKDGEQWLMLNTFLIRQGLAWFYYPGSRQNLSSKYKDQFRAAEHQAQVEQLGIWKKPSIDTNQEGKK